MIKVLLAKFLLKRMKIVPNQIERPFADKWNHLKAIVATDGKVKWDWNKVRGIPVVKCHRCCIVIRRGEYGKEFCEGCKEYDVKGKRKTARKRRKAVRKVR